MIPKWVIDVLISIYEAVMPHPASSEQKHVYRWRQTIAIAVLATDAVLIAHIILACNIIPGWNFGFARAADVQRIEQRIKVNEQANLEDKIITAMERFCDVGRNPMAKRFAYERIQGLMTTYEKETTHKYSLPSCDQL